MLFSAWDCPGNDEVGVSHSSSGFACETGLAAVNNPVVAGNDGEVAC